METNLDYKAARDLLLQAAAPVPAEQVPFDAAAGRVLAEEILAARDVPPFARSPFDGYAFRAEDTRGAGQESPVTLRILEEIPAGSTWTQPVTPGTAVKILTGAPVPPGADAVVKYEDTSFTEQTVTIFAEFTPRENVVPQGEDVKQGDLVAAVGTTVDAALTGTLAAQGHLQPLVYRRPNVGLITTGSELVPPGTELSGGKIVNTNLYTLRAELTRLGCAGEDHTCGDDPDEIAGTIAGALTRCDMLLLTGGVSVGDYDYTPEAMDRAGVTPLIRTLKLKPGGASAYGVREGKLVCGLSGNPASAMTNFYAVVLPALRRLCGYAQPTLTELPVTLADDFRKKSPKTRLIRGTLDLRDGTARMRVSRAQGNGVLHSLVGCDLLAEIPAGSPALPAGTALRAYLLP